jgi:hypothetical protein
MFFKALNLIARQIAYFQLLDPKPSHPYEEYFGGRYADVERGRSSRWIEHAGKRRIIRWLWVNHQPALHRLRLLRHP